MNVSMLDPTFLQGRQRAASVIRDSLEVVGILCLVVLVVVEVPCPGCVTGRTQVFSVIVIEKSIVGNSKIAAVVPLCEAFRYQWCASRYLAIVHAVSVLATGS